MSFYGVEHDVNLAAIRRRMLEVELELATASAGRKPCRGIRGQAERLGVSHMTLRRLLEGKSLSLDCLMQILTGLKLTFDEVVAPVVITVLASPTERVLTAPAA